KDLLQEMLRQESTLRFRPVAGALLQGLADDLVEDRGQVERAGADDVGPLSPHDAADAELAEQALGEAVGPHLEERVPLDVDQHLAGLPRPGARADVDAAQVQAASGFEILVFEAGE